MKLRLALFLLLTVLIGCSNEMPIASDTPTESNKLWHHPQKGEYFPR